MSRTPADTRGPRRLAAIDLGSNSFHLLVADYHEGQLRVATKLGEKVQLAAGLDEDDNLSEEAMQRALSCLARFAPFIERVPPRQLRIVGTNALRNASNSQTLIGRAEALLDHKIEIIAGREEARLIYLGVSRVLNDVQGKCLVIDIGGGSTEFIIGERFEPQALESLHMGCVAYTARFFGDGEITEARFRRAELAALSELATIRHRYLTLGWTVPVGSSGTVKAVAAVLAASGEDPDGLIRREGLRTLRRRLIGCKRLEEVTLEGLKADRARIFPAGVAILCAIFDAFGLASMRYSEGALREGVLHDLTARNTPKDTRSQSLDALRHRYGIDARQANNVANSASEAFDQVRHAWKLDDEQRQFLIWAAQLHEIGLAISHSRFHKHGAYLLEHSDLLGFSRPEQQVLAFLVRMHRRRFPCEEIEWLPSTMRPRCARLARLLRLAVVLNRSRPERPVSGFTLTADADTLCLALPESLTKALPLLVHDLQQEIRYQRAAGFSLELGPVMVGA